MRKKQSRFARQMIVLGSAFGTTGGLVRGTWKSKRWWLIPLIVFLCLNGLVLTLAASVQAFAPFVYAIF
jgi:hypothetical protein